MDGTSRSAREEFHGYSPRHATRVTRGLSSRWGGQGDKLGWGKVPRLGGGEGGEGVAPGQEGGSRACRAPAARVRRRGTPATPATVARGGKDEEEEEEKKKRNVRKSLPGIEPGIFGYQLIGPPERGSASLGHLLRSVDRRSIHCATGTPVEEARSAPGATPVLSVFCCSDGRARHNRYHNN